MAKSGSIYILEIGITFFTSFISYLFGFSSSELDISIYYSFISNAPACFVFNGPSWIISSNYSFENAKPALFGLKIVVCLSFTRLSRFDGDNDLILASWLIFYV